MRGEVLRGPRPEHLRRPRCRRALHERARAESERLSPSVIAAGEGDRVDRDRAAAHQADQLPQADRAVVSSPSVKSTSTLRPGGVGDPRQVDGDRVVERGVAAALGLEDPLDQALLVLAVVARDADVLVEEHVSSSRARGIASRKRAAASCDSRSSLQHALAGVEQQAQVEGQLRPLGRLHGAREEPTAWAGRPR